MSVFRKCKNFCILRAFHEHFLHLTESGHFWVSGVGTQKLLKVQNEFDLITAFVMGDGFEFVKPVFMVFSGFLHPKRFLPVFAFW